MKKGTVIQEAGKPLRYADVVDDEESPTPDPEVTKIADTIKAYRMEARSLLNGRYQGLKDVAPLHLRAGCNILALRCVDGICIRYDKSSDDKNQFRIATVTETLSEIVPKLSEGFVHATPNPSEFVPQPGGPVLTLNIGSPTGQLTELFQLFPVIVVATKFPDGSVVPLPPARPLCLASVQPIIEFDVEGFLVPTGVTPDPSDPNNDHFVARTPIRLPVGWEAIEVYPIQDLAYWDPSRAPMWAELDILAAAAQANLKAQAYLALDSRGKARKDYADLLAQFEGLLAGPEEPVHQFIKEHPELLCPTAEKTWSKLPFGEWRSDFVFREAYQDYLLVEIEAPIHELFREDGQQRQQVTHAIKQISDWVEYIEDNKILVETTLPGISSNPRRLVVIGRSSGLSNENRRALTNIQNAQPKLRILTYDDVLAQARTTLEKILGPLLVVSPDTQLYFFKPKPPMP
ncbi:MAG: DUF4263 domain-containing protein [Nitrospira sp.]|nr:DUF4263 domain-containing protein [Nitrospira sp.]